MHGTIKMVNQTKGWGFITPAAGDEVFFHRSAIHGQAWEFVERGQAVTFDLGEPKPGKGPRAERVYFA